MKNKNLSRAIGNINLKYVEEAEEYTAKRMNLTKIVSLAACLAIIVTAIPTALIAYRDSVNDEPSVITTPNKIEIKDPDKDNNIDENPVTIVYCDAKTAAEIKKAQNKDIEIRDISEIETDLSSKVGDIEASADIPARLYKTIGGKDYIFNFKSAYTTNLSTSSNDQLKKHGFIARYQVEMEDPFGYGLRYYYETEKIEYLRLTSYSLISAGENTITQEQVRVIAEKDLESLYGKEFLQMYNYDKCILVDNSERDYYIIEYRRMLCGYPTDERIVVNYSAVDAEFIVVHAINLSSFDVVDNSLDAEIILEAEKEALELIGDKVVKEKKLTVDKEGNVFIYLIYQDGKGTFDFYYSID